MVEPDLKIRLLKSDFQRPEERCISRAASIPVVKKALQRAFPGEEVLPPKEGSHPRLWKVGRKKLAILDGGREINHCRLQILANRSDVFLQVIRIYDA